jgi:hypothetical protein
MILLYNTTHYKDSIIDKYHMHDTSILYDTMHYDQPNSTLR